MPSRLRSIARTTLIGIVLGAVYASIADYGRPGPILNGIMIGTVVGFMAGWFETASFQRDLRRLPFVAVLLIRTAFHSTVAIITIVLVLFQYEGRQNGVPMTEVYFRPEMQRFFFEGELYRLMVFCVGAVFTWSFARQISRLLGSGTFGRLLMGRYHQPIREERVFLFAELVDAEATRTRLRPEAWHGLLNECFRDASVVMDAHRGEIYQYVDHEVVVSWVAERGLHKARCIQAFLAFQKRLANYSQDYVRRFGVAPRFRGAIHMGEVVAGDVGHFKREVVFHGDTVNSTARILGEANQRGAELLVSHEVLERLDAGLAGQFAGIGEISLRGRSQPVALAAWQGSSSPV